MQINTNILKIHCYFLPEYILCSSFVSGHHLDHFFLAQYTKIYISRMQLLSLRARQASRKAEEIAFNIALTPNNNL